MKVLFYVPNLIGYLRLICALGILFFHTRENYWNVALSYSASVILDFFDGYFARALNQCSKFGEFLDVLADNIARTFLWICVLSNLSGMEWVFGIHVIVLGTKKKKESQNINLTTHN